MLSFKLFLRNESYGCIVIGKIVRHRHNRLTDLLLVRAFFRYDEAISPVLLACGKLRCFTRTDLVDNLFYWNRVLNARLYPGTRRMASEWPWLTPLPQKV